MGKEDFPQDVWERAEGEAMRYVEWLDCPQVDGDAEHVLTVSFARAILAERRASLAELCPEYGEQDREGHQ